MNIRTLLRAIY